jgi:hypothetical protein
MKSLFLLAIPVTILAGIVIPIGLIIRLAIVATGLILWGRRVFPLPALVVAVGCHLPMARAGVVSLASQCRQNELKEARLQAAGCGALSIHDPGFGSGLQTPNC